jgi:mannose-6-phosphate isomerase-like protein (cupin superfamily)
MLEKRGDGAFEHTFHGGTAPMRMQWYFRERMTLPIAVHRWELPPGGTEGRHAHPVGDGALEELYVMLEGQAVMHVDGVASTLAPGDAVLAPAGSDHDLQNTGDGPAILLVIWGPPASGFDWTRYGSGRAAAAAAEGGR